MLVSFATAVNGRKQQEDKIFKYRPDSNEIFCGVLDGHGGPWLANYGAKYITFIFRAIRKKFPTATPEFILTETIARLHYKTRDFSCGSTLALTWIKDNIATVGILGDSSVIIRDSSGNLWKSPKHNVRYNSDEVYRIQTEVPDAVIYNGYLCHAYRVSMGGLQPTRCLGDKAFNSVLSRTPEIFSIALSSGSWVMCCTDGVTDGSYIVSQDIIVDPIFKPVNIDELSETIDDTNITAKEIISLGNTGVWNPDNASAILVRIG